MNDESSQRRELAPCGDLESDRPNGGKLGRRAQERGSEAVCDFAKDLPNHSSGGAFVGAKDDGTPNRLRHNGSTLW